MGRVQQLRQIVLFCSLFGGLGFALHSVAAETADTASKSSQSYPEPSQPVRTAANTVRPKLVGKSKEAVDDEAATTPVCVSALRARLRAGPGTKHKLNWEVAKYMPLERLKVVSGWAYVRDFRGELHWVLASNLTSDESCVVVRVKTAALYQGPGKEHPRAEFRVADKYTPFKKTDREGEWIKLEDDFKGVYWTLDSNLWIPVKRTSLAF